VTKTCPHCGAVIAGSNGARPGRPIRHHLADLVDCLGTRELTTGEFRQRAWATLDVSRATFFRLLERGRREWLFRQRANGKWVQVSQSHNGGEAFVEVPASVVELADRALAEDS
jgi:hypothetical protein